ncbi:MAG: methionine adenosyltransferase [Clostridiales bacterium]|jgi:S-adenosylmethionine synthetase|nr:methionine adenosyltransferase [Clostridiales bacterium]
MQKLFTSESVTAGHPDKLCDQISDTVLDAILTEDKYARVACETCATTGLILVMGEITTSTYVPIQDIARGVALDIGYTRAKFGFDGHTCAVLTAVNEQSEDISRGVTQALEARGSKDLHQTGAGDQGMMFGFACNETPEHMPLPIALAHRLARRMDTVRKEGLFPWMRPDGKSQVSIVYENGKPVAVRNVVISTQHDDRISQEEIREAMLSAVIAPVVPEHLLNKQTEFLVNPSGRFVIGGPAGDSGLTGRKIIVDTYGGFVPHGGGCFSGKDPTKVDRSAAYMARYAALNVVAAGLADRCQVALAYAIGRAEPVSFTVDTFGTARVDDQAIEKALLSVMDFRPDGIIDSLDLRRPIYRQTAAYGHFGRPDLDLPWEKADKTEQLLKAIR